MLNVKNWLLMGVVSGLFIAIHETSYYFWAFLKPYIPSWVTAILVVSMVGLAYGIMWWDIRRAS